MSNTDRFDSLTVEDLRRLGSVKWSKHPDALGAFIAEMDFGTAPPILDALRTAVDTIGFGYLPQALVRDLAEACAGWYSRRYGWTIEPATIFPVADVLKALEVTIQHASSPGSPVVLPTPAYMPFLFMPKLVGRDIIEVPMLQRDGRWVYDLDGLDRAFKAGGGLLVLCNPYNPLGRVMDAGELAAISEVVDRHRVRVFADEIHAPLVYEGNRHIPYASISPVTAGHTVTATSASKAWNLPGLKCAQIILSGDDAATWRQDGVFEEYQFTASSLGAVANIAAYTSGGPWLDDVVGYLDENRRLLGSLLSEHLPDVGYSMPEGTYLAWLDFRRTGFGAEPANLIHEKGGVALVDGNECGAAGAGFVRLNFATPKPILREIVTRIAGVAADLAS